MTELFSSFLAILDHFNCQFFFYGTGKLLPWKMTDPEHGGILHDRKMIAPKMMDFILSFLANLDYFIGHFFLQDRKMISLENDRPGKWRNIT